MNISILRFLAVTLGLMTVSLCGHAQTADSDTVANPDAIHYGATIMMQASSGEFSPYMIGSWNYGRTTTKNAALIDLEANRDLDLSKRFSWSAGIEVMAGYSHRAEYGRYDVETAGWNKHRVGPAPVWLQQLYGQVKFRGVFLTAGMKNHHSTLVDDGLSSGDLVMSTNARPIPMVTAGFIDFQNIPFTKGWVQIKGEIGYGKFADDDYMSHQYNYYNDHVALDVLYTYKNIYFRTNPDKPFSAMAGVQSAGQFGGNTKFYKYGHLTKTVNNPESFKTYWQMIFPWSEKGDGFIEGSHLGSWDFKASYRFGNGDRLSAYFQWLWEDGSSMAKRNKTDGLWGLQWQRPGRRFITGALVELLDFKDHSGPIHYAPGDHQNPSITTEATGRDGYYNNSSFNSHANYGMALGTPFMLSPVYNLDGFPEFIYNRTRGFHVGAEGFLMPTLAWKARVSYATVYGSSAISSPKTLHNTSAGVVLDWKADRLVRGLSVGLNMALDHGTLRGNNFGTLLSVKYSGMLSLKK